MREVYSKPQSEIESFKTVDVITTSTYADNNPGVEENFGTDD